MRARRWFEPRLQAARGRWEQQVVLPRPVVALAMVALYLAIFGAELAVFSLLGKSAPLAAGAPFMVIGFLFLWALNWSPLRVLSVLLPRRVGRRGVPTRGITRGTR